MYALVLENSCILSASATSLERPRSATALRCIWQTLFYFSGTLLHDASERTKTDTDTISGTFYNVTQSRTWTTACKPFFYTSHAQAVKARRDGRGEDNNWGGTILHDATHPLYQAPKRRCKIVGVFGVNVLFKHPVNYHSWHSQMCLNCVIWGE